MDTKDKTGFLPQGVCILVKGRKHILTTKVDNAIGKKMREMTLTQGRVRITGGQAHFQMSSVWVSFVSVFFLFVVWSHLKLIFEMFSNFRESKIGIFMRRI